MPGLIPIDLSEDLLEDNGKLLAQLREILGGSLQPPDPRRIADLEVEVDRLQTELTTANTTLATRTAQWETEQHESSRLSRELESTQEKLELLARQQPAPPPLSTVDPENTIEQIEILKQQVTQLSNELKQGRKRLRTVKTLQQQVQSLKQELADRETRDLDAVNLKERLKVLEASIKQKESQINGLETEERRLRSDLAVKDGELKSYKNRIRNMQRPETS